MEIKKLDMFQQIFTNFPDNLFIVTWYSLYIATAPEHVSGNKLNIKEYTWVLRHVFPSPKLNVQHGGKYELIDKNDCLSKSFKCPLGGIFKYARK